MEVGQGGIWTQFGGIRFLCVRVCVVLFFVILQRMNRFRL